MAQSLLPWATVPAAPIAIAAAIARRWALAGAALATTAAGVWFAAHMAGRRPRRRLRRTSSGGTEPTGETDAVSIAHVNLLFVNERLGADVAVLAALDVDVVTFSEYTAEHAATLHASELAERYPFRIERPAPAASGSALWSRRPICQAPAPRLSHEVVAADVSFPGPHGAVLRIVVVHPSSPVHNFRVWCHDLAVLAAERPDPPSPAVMLGDFNAGWNHPELRDIVARGWRSAHRERGVGLSASWPADRLLPAFVRIDHALVAGPVVVADVDDFVLPGSDHKGLVVSVAPAP